MRINSSRRGHDMYVSIHTPTYVSEQVTNSRSDLRFFVLVPARCLASTNNKYNNCLLTVLKTNPGLSSLCKVHSVIISVYGRERGVIQPRPLEKLSGDRHPPPPTCITIVFIVITRNFRETRRALAHSLAFLPAFALASSALRGPNDVVPSLPR